LPALRGRYVYTDYCDGQLRSLIPHSTGRASDDRPLGGLSVVEPSSFGVDARGRLYVCSLTGPVYRLVPREGWLARQLPRKEHLWRAAPRTRRARPPAS